MQTYCVKANSPLRHPYGSMDDRLFESIENTNTQCADYLAYAVRLRAEVKRNITTAATREHRLHTWRGKREALIADIRKKARRAFLLSQKIPQLEAQVDRDVAATALLAEAEEDDTQIMEKEAELADLRAAKRRRKENARDARLGDNEEGEESGEEAKGEEGKEPPPLERVAAPQPPQQQAPQPPQQQLPQLPPQPPPLNSPSPFGPEFTAILLTAVNQAMATAMARASPITPIADTGSSTSSASPEHRMEDDRPPEVVT